MFTMGRYVVLSFKLPNFLWHDSSFLGVSGRIKGNGRNPEWKWFGRRKLNFGTHGEAGAVVGRLRPKRLGGQTRSIVCHPQGDAVVPSAKVLLLFLDAPKGIGGDLPTEAQEEEAHLGLEPACHRPASIALDFGIGQPTEAKEATDVEEVAIAVPPWAV
ncbi:hypothetical protein Nepgr_013420 [Nepenthes gracilis]|uniref:Uncharacterized protein n=1 Tax=Nepenthes gracilis TaxID=150966 RepID=A0AAD3XP36_NEPGR|nr:hypothetical protein Nepgr_013420 [Nepenthes gracilis]